MSTSPNERCPCDSGIKYKRCCGPWHAGAPAPTPEALMRSRYAAYASGKVDYIVVTTHADSPHREANVPPWRADLTRFVSQTTFDGLTVRATTTDGERGTVTFEARLRQGGRDATMLEESLFFRVDGRWLYHSGTRPSRD